ncbi:Hypothetical protein FKW44_006609, partial [Caligus rogercresseyi]
TVYIDSVRWHSTVSWHHFDKSLSNLAVSFQKSRKYSINPEKAAQWFFNLGCERNYWCCSQSRSIQKNSEDLHLGIRKSFDQKYGKFSSHHFCITLDVCAGAP